MKLLPIGCRRAVAGLGALLAGLAAPPAAPARGDEPLQDAFRTCVSLYGHPLAGALMRAIGDAAQREAFAAAHLADVGSFSFEREHGYSTATATLKHVVVAGVRARAIYASTCELDCPLAVWGLEFGALTPGRRNALQAWADAAPSTHTGQHGDIKVQLGDTSDGQTVLVCDVSG